MWARCWIRCTDYRATKHEYTYRGQIMENHWFTIATNVKHIWFGWMVFQRMCAGVRLYKTLTTTFNKWLEITQISYTQEAFIFNTIDWHVSEFKECRELERKNGVRQKKYWHEPSGRQQHCHNNFSEIVGIFLPTVKWTGYWSWPNRLKSVMCLLYVCTLKHWFVGEFYPFFVWNGEHVSRMGLFQLRTRMWTAFHWMFTDLWMCLRGESCHLQII